MRNMLNPSTMVGVKSPDGEQAGAVVVHGEGIAGNPVNRELAAVVPTYVAADVTTNMVTYTPAENVRQVTIICTAIAVAQDEDYVRYVLDAGSNGIVAEAWFAEAGGAAVSINPDKIPYNTPVTLSFTDYITDIHFEPSDSAPALTHIGISGVGV